MAVAALAVNEITIKVIAPRESSVVAGKRYQQ